MISLLLKAILIAVYLLALTIFGYTFLLADIDGSGLNGRLSRLLFVFVPKLVCRKAIDCLGPAAFNSLIAFFDHVVNKSNLIMPSL